MPRRPALDIFVLNASAAHGCSSVVPKPVAANAPRVRAVSESTATSTVCRTRPICGGWPWTACWREMRYVPQGTEAQAGSLGRDRGAHPSQGAGGGAGLYRRPREDSRRGADHPRTACIEHHAEVDCGTVVENSTILPFTCVGAGLDVMHSRRRLPAPRASGAQRGSGNPRRQAGRNDRRQALFLDSQAALLLFLPSYLKRFTAACLRRSDASRPRGVPESLGAGAAAYWRTPVVEAPASGPEASEFPSNLAVVRRYGDH